MRLLVTRPEPEAEETARILRAAGHDVLVDPLLHIHFAEPPAELPAPGAVLLTSRNGVRALLRWPASRGWRDRPVFTVGGATAAAAREAGFSDVASAEGDVGDLTALILGADRPDIGPIVYPAARDRAGDLPAALAARGYDLRVIEAYRAEPTAAFRPPVHDALANGTVDGALFFSRRTAEAFVRRVDAEALADRLAGLRCYALSAAVALPLGALAGVSVAVAPRPDQDSLLTLLPPA